MPVWLFHEWIVIIASEFLSSETGHGGREPKLLQRLSARLVRDLETAFMVDVSTPVRLQEPITEERHCCFRVWQFLRAVVL